MLTVYDILSSLERDEDLHLGRILILINEFSRSKHTGIINGLTKLAKLDFLLRYPVYLEKALEARNTNVKKVNLKDYEKRSVESKMIRFKYGPWDFRYRRFINILIGKGLVFHYVEGKTINVGITTKGEELVKKLEEDDIHRDTLQRAKILKQHFDLSGSYLMNFVYRVFPEIGTLKYGEKIEYGD